MKKLAVLVSLALPCSVPAVAEDISANGECSYVNTFEGPGATTLFFSQSQAEFEAGDRVLVGVMNDIWSLKKGDEVGEIKFDGPDAWFSAEAIAIDGGFGLLIDWKYFYDVFDESSGSVGIVRKGKEIDRLSLSPTWMDAIRFSSCRGKRVAEKAERERKLEIERRWSEDPFAK